MSLEDYDLIHMTENIMEILEDGNLIPTTKLHKKNKKYDAVNAPDLMPFVYMTLIKKKNMEKMESLNYYYYYGIFMYLVFDSSLLVNQSFYINKRWDVNPTGEIIKKGDNNMLEKIKEYADTLKNECLFKRNISLKKYLKEIHISGSFLKKHKDIKIEKIIELTKEKYKNIEIKIINPKIESNKKMEKYFLAGEKLPEKI